MTQTIKRIGEKNITEEKLIKSVYKSLGAKERFTRRVDTSYIRAHITGQELIHHPFWMVKSLIVAARPPFPPKKIPRMIFIDAVSGYRGIFSHVPTITEEEAADGSIAAPFLRNEEDIDIYIRHVQEKQINKQYLLKKPEHEVVEKTLAHLPIFKVRVESAEINDVFYINANTGESEAFLSERWRSKKDLLQ
ncbi:hypothetical protein [Lacicoccus alkaliphilus]|uniref:Uncharacterized protein n=1 Tax=Lacicoccus alkaliphilus DSM 16010 TaxID=1123231 RepID=A0A1M7HFQ6_9BACL|nr:hypothetical protein [Salinicoccus alkaliphilus]SHM27322.1 hypothetical protein SAMN02745189_01851 [Salinicoccus alkaliphilus DSM 16010]